MSEEQLAEGIPISIAGHADELALLHRLQSEMDIHGYIGDIDRYARPMEGRLEDSRASWRDQMWACQRCITA
jgi:hypothetical protein